MARMAACCSPVQWSRLHFVPAAGVAREPNPAVGKTSVDFGELQIASVVFHQGKLNGVEQMRRLLLVSAAVAALAVNLPALHAQQDGQRDKSPAAGAAQQSSPQAPDRGERAAPRQERSSGQATQPQAASPGGSQMRAGDDNRRRGTSNARGKHDDSTRGRAEPSQSSGQIGERSGKHRRDARDEAREDKRDRADRNRDRADRERSTTGQYREDRATESRRSGNSLRSDSDRRDRADRDRDNGRRNRTDRGRDPRESVKLSQEQRTRISARFSERIDRLHVRPISRSRISVSVGVVLPSAIRVHDIPVEIVDIYPSFRGHKFVLVEDEIVIIQPRSRRIVATIPRDGERASLRSTTGAAATGSRLRLQAEDRSVIRTVVLREAECRYETRIDFRIGLPLPRTVQICEFPDEIVAQVPGIRSYRYVVHGDDIALIDPEEHRIIEVID